MTVDDSPAELLGAIEELRRRQAVTLLGVRVHAATAEDTILAKLEWSKASGSERQLDDVAGIPRVRAETLDLDDLEHWIDELDLHAVWVHARERVAP